MVPIEYNLKISSASIFCYFNIFCYFSSSKVTVGIMASQIHFRSPFAYFNFQMENTLLMALLTFIFMRINFHFTSYLLDSDLRQLQLCHLSEIIIDVYQLQVILACQYQEQVTMQAQATQDLQALNYDSNHNIAQQNKSHPYLDLRNFIIMKADFLTHYFSCQPHYSTINRAQYLILESMNIPFLNSFYILHYSCYPPKSQEIKNLQVLQELICFKIEKKALD